MDKKTIGGFIAALRRASGMTQRELAERLNVSDKTVSRWERDEGAPDLALIPVLAEIFGVTCDELLCGARRSSAQRAAGEPLPAPRSDKQRQRLLVVSRSRFRARSLIALGVAGAGLMAAMVANLAFLRAYVGFFAGAALLLAAAVLQALAVNAAFLAVEGGELPGEEQSRFRRDVWALAARSFGLMAALIGFLMPLALLPGDAYLGLSAQSWFMYGACGAAVALGAFGTICHVLGGVWLSKGAPGLSEAERGAYVRRRRLLRRCVAGAAALMLMTGGVQSVLNATLRPEELAEPLLFDDYESFIRYMEQDVPDPSAGDAGLSPGETIYYDEQGNQVDEEQALRHEIVNARGEVVCAFVWRNRAASMFSYSDGEDLLPIRVRTVEALEAAQARVDMRNGAFALAYLAEAALALAVYLRRRAG